MAEKKKKKTEEPQKFKNKRAIFKYLNSKGYKVAQATFYLHAGKEAKIRPDLENGEYSIKCVQNYAITNLAKTSTLEKEKTENLTRKEKLQSISFKEKQEKLLDLKLAKLQGRVFEKEDVYRVFASMGVGLENSLKGQVQTDADEAIEIIESSKDKRLKFIEIVYEIIDRGLHEFSRISNLEAIFGEET